MLKCLRKTTKQIEHWQEDCATFQLFLQKLLGEDAYNENSIADMSVKPMPLGKKKKDMNEIITDNSETKQIDMSTGKPKNKVARSVVIGLKTGKFKQVGEDEEPTEANPLQEPSDDSEAKDTSDSDNPSRAKILKTETVMETNTILVKWVDQYFARRRAGNFNEASIIKKRIENMIKEKDLDRDTVYYSGTGGAIDSDETDSDTEEL